jgi:mannose-6-phosphate isomerase-like protein (cupin superfamily)
MGKNWRVALVASILTLGLHIGAQEPGAKQQPQTFFLECTGGDCPLLKGAPQTKGMRAGSVRLKPGERVGWHSTAQNEETLTILRGSGVVNIEGQPDVALRSNMLAYIPPRTRHNVTNTGNEVLEYVWVVAPVKEARQSGP